jgi:DNA-binding CsgD family transcriptional regulator
LSVRDGIDRLTAREKETLRLLFAGHDAKSIARHLSLSVHTVNERLRDARRKLNVSSSREAARLLAEREGPNSLGDNRIGVGGPRPVGVRLHGASNAERGISRLAWLGGGMLTMSLIVAFAALSAAFPATGGSPMPKPPKVLSASPREGATIAPGAFVLSVTYDQPMQPGSYSFAGPRELAPEACGPAEQSKDGRTYSMRCNASPGRQYEIWFNREPYMNFQSTAGVRAQPYRLRFKVAAE